MADYPTDFELCYGEYVKKVEPIFVFYWAETINVKYLFFAYVCWSFSGDNFDEMLKISP